MTSIIGLIVAVLATPLASAQSLEPRAYGNTPTGMNFLLLGITHSRGDVLVDPSIPLEGVDTSAYTAVLGYSRSFGLWGRSAKVNTLIPYAKLEGQGEFLGEEKDRNITDFADPAFSFSVNLMGAPALTAAEFKEYEQDLIVGLSLVVIAPWGQYDSSKVVNLGTNRWAVEPEIGISKKLGPWILEGALAVTFFTENDDYFGGSTREQDPIGSLQAHVIYSFPNQIWLAFDANYYAGGATSVDGEELDDEQANSRYGLTLALPIDRRNSIKLYGSTGAFARRGTSFDLLGIGWQVRWGGGL